MSKTAEQRVRGLALWKGAIDAQAADRRGEQCELHRQGRKRANMSRGSARTIPCHHVFRERELRCHARRLRSGPVARTSSIAEPGIMVVRLYQGATPIREDRCAGEFGALRRDRQDAATATCGGAMTGPGAIFWVFHVLRDYAQTLRAAKPPAWSPIFRAGLRAVDKLEDAQVPLPIVFGHHDLLPDKFHG